MKFFLAPLIILNLIKVYAQPVCFNCKIENPNYFLQNTTYSVTPRLNNFQLHVKNGSYPKECNVYSVKYNLNGKPKDSVLIRNTKWNNNGTLKSETIYNISGDIFYYHRYTYENIGHDSIITSTGKFRNTRYYLNEKNLVFKEEIAEDSNFTAFKRIHYYEYDESNNFIDATIKYQESKTYNVKWEYSSIDHTAKVYRDDRLYRVVRLNQDSCFVEDVAMIGGNPVKLLFYFDSKGNVIKEVYFIKLGKRIKSYTLHKEWNSVGKLTREYGKNSDRRPIDERYYYNDKGLLIQIKDHISKKNYNYHYNY